jgi:hypothetical protein
VFGFFGIRVLKGTKVGASYNSLGKTWVVRVDKKTWDLQFKGGGNYGESMGVSKELIKKQSWKFLCLDFGSLIRSWVRFIRFVVNQETLCITWPNSAA